MALQKYQEDESKKIKKFLQYKLEQINQIVDPEGLARETQGINILRNDAQEILKNVNQMIDAALVRQESLISEDLEKIKQNLSKLEKIKQTLTKNQEVANQYITEVNNWKQQVEDQENIRRAIQVKPIKEKDDEFIKTKIQPKHYYLTTDGVKLGSAIIDAIAKGKEVIPFIYSALLSPAEQALVSDAIKLVSLRKPEDTVEVIQGRIEQAREFENRSKNPQAKAQITEQVNRLSTQREWAQVDAYLRERVAQRRNAVVNIPETSYQTI